jgi:hypothetical protein
MAILSIKLDLPDEVVKQYELRGSLEKVLSDQLTKCVNYTSTKPLYLTDIQRRRLDRLFGKNLKDPEELVHMMERYVTARIGDVDIQLSPALLTRLKTRCFGKPFEQFLAERATIGLEEYCGLR